MIVAFSTSSPWASVAAIAPTGEVLWECAEEAPRRASAACMTMVEELDRVLPLSGASLFVADIGPGSFIGVRVGVTLAKTFAFAYDTLVAGASAFDLVSTESVVAVPSRKGEMFVRQQGKTPFRTSDPLVTPWLGYGPDQLSPTFPLAARFADLLDLLVPTTPEQFVPEYLIQPSISMPKKAFVQRRPA